MNLSLTSKILWQFYTNHKPHETTAIIFLFWNRFLHVLLECVLITEALKILKNYFNNFTTKIKLSSEIFSLLLYNLSFQHNWYYKTIIQIIINYSMNFTILITGINFYCKSTMKGFFLQLIKYVAIQWIYQTNPVVFTK